MLCSRGRKRKSFEMDEDQENLLTLDDDYVCMTGTKLHPRNSRKIPKHFNQDWPLARNLQAQFEENDYLEAKCLKQGILKGRGQLHVSIYVNCGLLTVHVIQASHLSQGKEDGCCAFVKVSLSPDHSKRTKCRTSTAARSCNPVFDEKFSFELLEDDMKKRILISVWHRARANEHSECLGCMSFGIQHIISQRKIVDGWYYLLTEDIGKRKHLQVAARMRFSSPARPEHHGHIPCSPIAPDHRMTSPIRVDPRGGFSPARGDPRVTSTPMWDPASSRQSTPRKKEPVYTELTVCTPASVTTVSGMSHDPCTESHVFVIKRGDGGYGFSVTGACPVRVTRVDSRTPAESVGLQRDDLIVILNGASMTKANADTVAKIIKSSEKKIIMEVKRSVRTLPPGQEDTPKFTDNDPVVSTPEYTPLVFHGGKGALRRAVRSPSPPPPRRSRDREKGERRKGVKSIGMCAALPVRRVRFYDDVT